MYVSEQQKEHGVYYWPPNQRVDEDEIFENQIGRISEGHDVVVMGDFNYPGISWEANSAKYGPSKKIIIPGLCHWRKKLEDRSF